MLAALDASDWRAAAAAAATAGPDAPLLADIAAWHRLRAGDGRAAEYAAFLARRPDWPGLALLRARGERTLDAAADPAAVRAFFAAEPPRTPDGGMALIAARRAGGDADGARAEAVRMWQEMALDAAAEAALLAAFADTLAPHHAARLDRLLWEGQIATARRMLPLVDEGRQRLAEARIALQDRADGVDARVAAVPDALAGDPGLARDRTRWRLRAGLINSAADLIEARSSSADSLGRPEAWAADRARIVRELLDEGAPTRALRIAEAHHLSEGADFADLEWLAGFIALRRLDDPARALGHFRTLRAGVTSPINLLNESPGLVFSFAS
ncbi:MAG: lytic transglycosylase domain-containing protein, partial [Rhodobacteraceae bacterium]|nr:lytic transglycosylase domain-containing protein [Paracoccaceae bacterium]